MRARTALLVCLCLSVLGCASSQWAGRAKRALREPGEHLLDLPERVAADYGCAERALPYFELERNEINPNRIRAGGELNHRIVYALCPRSSTEVVSGELTTRVRFKGAVLLTERIPGFEFKPGRWSVDAFVRLPKAAEKGVYALEIRFEKGPVHLDESLTFGVDG